LTKHTAKSLLIKISKNP